MTQSVTYTTSTMDPYAIVLNGITSSHNFEITWKFLLPNRSHTIFDVLQIATYCLFSLYNEGYQQFREFWHPDMIDICERCMHALKSVRLNEPNDIIRVDLIYVSDDIKTAFFKLHCSSFIQPCKVILVEVYDVWRIALIFF